VGAGPAAPAPGSYPLQVTAGDARATGALTVIGDHVEFAPGTDEEAPWLFEADGSSLDNGGRFADNSNHFTYRLRAPAGGTVTLDIGNQFLVRTSTDNESWTTVLEETNPIRNLSNRAGRTVDLPAGTSYVRIEDSQPADGWGGWLGGVTLDLEG
jgi:hypothetical protein